MGECSFWYRPTRVVPDQRPLNGRCCCCCCWSNRCGDIAIFCDFQDGGGRHLGFSKIQNFNGRSAVRGKYASPCQISSNSVKRLRRYGDLTVFKMAAVRHLEFLKFTFCTVAAAADLLVCSCLRHNTDQT